MPEIPTDLRVDLEQAVQDCDCELVHVAYGGNRLQLMVENEHGTTVEHCEQVSRRVSPILDVHDFGADKYVLEVTSPGLDRPLFGPRDFARFAGHQVKVQWLSQEGGKRTDSGLLERFDPGKSALTLLAANDIELTIPAESVLKANLEIEI